MTSNVEPPNYHHHHHPHMHNSPWAHYYYRGGWCRRGGSRLIWFLLGAGAATWYLHRDRRGSCGPHDDSYRWRRLRGEEGSLPVESGGPTHSRDIPYDWKPEIDRMKQFGRQASNRVAELGDAGLESALSAVATLRLKLREAEEKARVMQEQSRTAPSTAPVDQSSPAQNSPHESSSWPS